MSEGERKLGEGDNEQADCGSVHLEDNKGQDIVDNGGRSRRPSKVRLRIKRIVNDQLNGGENREYQVLEKYFEKGEVFSFVPNGCVCISTIEGEAPVGVIRDVEGYLAIEGVQGALIIPDKGEWVVWGRGVDNDLEDIVSRNHIAIRRRGEIIDIRDLGTRNGTLLRGEVYVPNIPEREERETIVSIGDSDGGYGVYIWNLQGAGIIDEDRNWIAGNKKVIVHGDILADRYTDGFAILEKNRELREQARANGGDIVLLAGNHEDYMISFLTDRNGIHGGGLVHSMHNDQGRGMLELTEYSGNRTFVHSFEGALERGRFDRREILENMRKSPRGKIIMDEICNMKLVEIEGDVLFLHTDPTDDIFRILIERGLDVDAINEQFQGALRRCLIEGECFDSKDNHLFDAFLDTENRTVKYNRLLMEGGVEGVFDELLLRGLKRCGINKVVFAHSDLGEGNAVLDYQEIQFLSVNFSALRSGNNAISAVEVGIERE